MKHVIAIIVIVTALVLCLARGARSEQLVFPGAEGFGVTTAAGRGGRIAYVTTLEDDGPGSLRRAVEIKVPRAVVFEVSGTIVLKRKLIIDSPYISILGQTAPEPGITLKGNTLTIRTHDVLVQHLRIRVSDETTDPRPWGLDCLQILAKPSLRDLYPDSIGTYNVVVDHCTFSWAMDENISISRARDITISNCILSEALDKRDYAETGHSMAALFKRVERLAFVGNLIAHCASRTPRFAGWTQSVVCNNVVYNSRWNGMEITSKPDVPQPVATFIGNLVIPGPDSRSGTRFPIWVNRIGAAAKIYVADTPCGAFDGDAWSCVSTDSTAEAARVDTPPVECTPLTVRPATETLAWVLGNAGARPAQRDSIDARIIDQVSNQGGRIIASQNDVGGWPRPAGAIHRLAPPSTIAEFDRWLAELSNAVEGRVLAPR